MGNCLAGYGDPAQGPAEAGHETSCEESAGIEVERGTQTNKTFIWKESSDRWSFGSESVEAGTFFGSFIGSVTGSPSSLAGLSTDDLAEGSTNLYFTNTRARGALSGGTGISYNNTTGAIVNSAPDQTVTLSGSGATSVSGTYPNFTISSTDTNTLPNNATITISAGTDLTTGGAFTTDQDFGETITINHVNIGRTNSSTSASPGYGASFTAIDSITTNARGHVTAVNTKTVTIPASDNTDTNTVTQIREDSGTYRTGNITLQSGTNVSITESSAGVFNFAATDTNTTNFNIQASGGTATNISAGQTINFTGSGATSVSRSGNTITITSTDTNTDTNNYVSSASFNTGNGILTLNRQGLGAVTVDLDGRFVTSSGVTSITAGTGLSGGTITSTGTISLPNSGVTASTYGNSTNIPQIAVDAQGRITSASNVAVSIPSGANNATITLSAGNGLTGGQSFTTDQASNQTITFNVGAGDGISVAANAVAVDSTVLRAGTGTLINDIINANVITADMIQANSIVATLINADTISANNITTGTLNASNVTISNLRADDITGGVTEIFMLADRGSTYITTTASSLFEFEIPAPQFGIKKHGFVEGDFHIGSDNNNTSNNSGLSAFRYAIFIQKKSRGQTGTSFGTVLAAATEGSFLFSVTVSGNYSAEVDLFSGVADNNNPGAVGSLEAVEYDITNNRTKITYSYTGQIFTVGETLYVSPDKWGSSGLYVNQVGNTTSQYVGISHGQQNWYSKFFFKATLANTTASETYRFMGDRENVNGDTNPSESTYSSLYSRFVGTMGYTV